MIYAKKIIIKEFRGIRDLTVDLNQKNYAIWGRNGTGKSGIVDALEFVLTGNISRLSGRGMGNVSVKDHAPHVDSRNNPEKAKVLLEVYIPSIDVNATIERSVKNILQPIINPNNKKVVDVFEEIANHPEFVLSRKELIRYVVSTPGDRAKEVQALLRIDSVEDLRASLFTIQNSFKKSIPLVKTSKEYAKGQLLQALNITELSDKKILEAVNEKRKLLKLSEIDILTPTTSIKDGLLSIQNKTQPDTISKLQAINKILELQKLISKLQGEEETRIISASVESLLFLNQNAEIVNNIERDDFFNLALKFVDKNLCPVCDTPWDRGTLIDVIKKKIEDLQKIKKQKTEIEDKIVPIKILLTEVEGLLTEMERYGLILKPSIDTKIIQGVIILIRETQKAIKLFLPINNLIDRLSKIKDDVISINDTILKIKAAVEQIPEPNQQDAARDYLTICQERLETYRKSEMQYKKISDQALLTNKIYTQYADVSTRVLNDIYKEVEKDFSSYYEYINKDDEIGFTAKLIPSTGKLGFDVDFYGKGFFPPGAYHSEGHQDSMGICLYLALMKHLQGESFTFSVLDDVLMSVDTGHRREICNLLKTKFPNTQFIITTHDDIWLRYMKSAALIEPDAYKHFRDWNVNLGPKEWKDKDIWEEIKLNIRNDEIQLAASQLRNYLEYIFTEICNELRAPVPFRGDAKYEFGDLFPSALSRLRKIIKKAKDSAISWGKKNEEQNIIKIEEELDLRIKETKSDDWQTNAAIHYNNWANFNKVDIEPVVEAYQNLLKSYFCNTCFSILKITKDKGQDKMLTCRCGAVNINLEVKKGG